MKKIFSLLLTTILFTAITGCSKVEVGTVSTNTFKKLEIPNQKTLVEKSALIISDQKIIPKNHPIFSL
jgi:hypothetical protein